MAPLAAQDGARGRHPRSDLSWLFAPTSGAGDTPDPTCRGYLPRQVALVVPISNDKSTPVVHNPRQVEPGRPQPTTSRHQDVHNPRQVRHCRPKTPRSQTAGTPCAAGPARTGDTPIRLVVAICPDKWL